MCSIYLTFVVYYHVTFYVNDILCMYVCMFIRTKCLYTRPTAHMASSSLGFRVRDRVRISYRVMVRVMVRVSTRPAM